MSEGQLGHVGGASILYGGADENLPPNLPPPSSPGLARGGEKSLAEHASTARRTSNRKKNEKKEKEMKVKEKKEMKLKEKEMEMKMKEKKENEMKLKNSKKTVGMKAYKKPAPSRKWPSKQKPAPPKAATNKKTAPPVEDDIFDLGAICDSGGLESFTEHQHDLLQNATSQTKGYMIETSFFDTLMTDAVLKKLSEPVPKDGFPGETTEHFYNVISGAKTDNKL